MLNFNYIRKSFIKKARDYKISLLDIVLVVFSCITAYNVVVIQAQNPKVNGSHSIPGQISDSSSLNTGTYSPSDFYLKNEDDLVSSSDEFGENQLTPSEHNSLREKKINLFNHVYIELNADYTGHVVAGTTTRKILTAETIKTAEHTFTYEESKEFAPDLHKLLKNLDNNIDALGNNLNVKYKEVLEVFNKKRGLVAKAKETLLSFTQEEIVKFKQELRDMRVESLSTVLLSKPIKHNVITRDFDTEVYDFVEVLHKANLRLTAGVKLPSNIKVASSAIVTYEKSSGLELGGKLSFKKYGHSYSAMITRNLQTNKNSFSLSVEDDFSDFRKFLADRLSLGGCLSAEPTASIKEVDGVAIRRDVKVNIYTWFRLNIFRIGTK